LVDEVLVLDLVDKKTLLVNPSLNYYYCYYYVKIVWLVTRGSAMTATHNDHDGHRP